MTHVIFCIVFTDKLLQNAIINKHPLYCNMSAFSISTGFIYIDNLDLDHVTKYCRPTNHTTGSTCRMQCSRAISRDQP